MLVGCVSFVEYLANPRSEIKEYYADLKKDGL